MFGLTGKLCVINVVEVGKRFLLLGCGGNG